MSALWAVDITATFEDASFAALNLGHDADTVGAVTGQLAGTLYCIEVIFQRLLGCLVKLDEIQGRFGRLW